LSPHLSRYGLGWVIHQRRGVREVWHAGSTPGYQSLLARYVDHDACLVLLANAAGLPLEELHGALAELLLGDAMAPPGPCPPRDARLAPGQPQGYVGSYIELVPARYSRAPRWEAEVYLEPGEPRLHLLLRTPRGERCWPLRPVRADRFVVDSPAGWQVTFRRAATGEVTELIVDACGMIHPLVRRREG